MVTTGNERRRKKVVLYRGRKPGRKPPLLMNARVLGELAVHRALRPVGRGPSLGRVTCPHRV
jgi:hypothetical protein